MPCPRCEKRGRPKNFGSAPQCAFEAGVFDTANWQCATMNVLRALVGDAEAGLLNGWKNRDGPTQHSIGILHVPEYKDGGGFHIVMSWYKERGQTARAYVFRSCEGPTELTLPEAELAIEACTALK